MTDIAELDAKIATLPSKAELEARRGLRLRQHPKMVVLETIVRTNTPARIKTNRSYIKIDVKTATLILDYCTHLGYARSFLNLGWQTIEFGARAWKENHNV